MAGKQKGFTLIEILVVVTIIGVLASLVIVLIPKTQRQAQITESINNVKQIVSLLEVAGDTARYPNQSGANLVLYLVLKQEIMGDNLKVLFSPGDPDETLDRAGGAAAYKTLDLNKHEYGHLTSYAGRDLQNTQCNVVKGSNEPMVLCCDDSDNHYGGKRLGFVVGFTGGRAKFQDKVDDYKLSYDSECTIGENSQAPELKCLRAD
jgi:prepilin-type N-terminal cleavage/methylation domain-containing protein